MSATLAGEIDVWPTKEVMAKLLRQSGLTVVVGNYSIRVEDCSHFTFESFGNAPCIEADADDAPSMLRDAQLVSTALARAGIRHRFEIYDDTSRDAVGYVHHNWPQ